MYWARRRPVAVVALFALLLQLALGFGHLHHADQDRSQAITLAHDQAAAPPDHDEQDSDTRHNHLCAICVALNLLSGAQIAGTPLALPEAAWRQADLAPPRADVLAEQRRCNFRSRAPPLA